MGYAKVSLCVKIFRTYQKNAQLEKIMTESLTVNDKEYKIVKLLGKGKGGYSYLAERDGKRHVLEQIHHEPCAYYLLGDKIQAEIYDYNRLKAVGVRMPAMLDVDVQAERILKEFVEGDTIFHLVLQDKTLPNYVHQMRETCVALYNAHLNADYFPTNFVVNNGQIYYVDFECNDYVD